jgi:chitin disaccharide deacetylase
MFTSNVVGTHPEAQSTGVEGNPHQTGCLIVNADDWGRDRETTDRTLDCLHCGTVSSVSAMVFLEDSARAAGIAQDHGIDAGLHLNFTSAFSAPGVSSRLMEHQKHVSKYLLRHRFSRVVFHPGLTRSFAYVVAAQLDEFARLYGREPDRLDGHHHMHLSANVLFGRLMPAGTKVRRNFSFRPGEKSWINRLYRTAIDSILEKRHQLTDYFFALPPLAPQNGIDQIFSIARRSVVELETHPVNLDEFRFLTRGEMLREKGDLQIARGFRYPTQTRVTISAKDRRGDNHCE